METLLSIMAGSIGGGVAGIIGGGIIVFLARTWISERLKQSIQHEYDQKIETLKAEFKASMQAKDFQHQIYQLKTSLFFDHQREAFACIISQIAETRKKWIETVSDPMEGLIEPVPSGEYEKVKKLFYDKQLFLDSDCIFVMNLVLQAMSDSLPFYDGEKERYRDVGEPYRRLAYLQDRMAEIFKEKIGLGTAEIAKTEVAFLCAIRLVNTHGHLDIKPIKDSMLKLKYGDNAADAVLKAKNNKEELIERLIELEKCFDREGFLYEYGTLTKKCLEILSEI